MSTDRQGMVAVIKKEYRLNSPKVTDTMMKIPREEFAPKRFREIAYDDCPVDIGYGQTMSQPYTVAIMTHLATEIPNTKDQNSSKLQKTFIKSKVLEIGTGSGYQAALLSNFFDEVYTIEIVPQLAKQASKTLKRLGYKNIFIKGGSGERGWKEKSPYDAIMITAGVVEVPKGLFRQLKVGGVLVAPVGKSYDKIMTRLTKQSRFKDKLKSEEFGTFHFVPFIKEN
jgi:protein-L-isoaspartate(D-aspartate) O-methyltransferase